MLSRAPRSLLVVGLALPLAVTLPSLHAVNDIRSKISIGANDAVAAPPETTAGSVEYMQEGTQYILRARGKDLDALHSTASQEFIHRIEEEIKKPGARLTISNFETHVRFENGKFIFEYKVKLNPAQDQNEVHTLISMRGTVWCGKDAKSRVIAENTGKVPGWRQRMRAAYPDMKIWYETARSENNSSKGPLFHEAVLAKGAVIPTR